MCACIRATLSFVLLFISSTPSLYAQASQISQEETVLHLQGVVVDALSGKGISRALVASADRRLAGMTDSKGQFSFDIALPPGTGKGRSMQTSILLSAERPGYGKLNPLAIELDTGTPTRTIELRLTPAAAIAGHIYAPGTNSPRNVQVTLLQRTVQNGFFTWRPANSRNTDRFGAFNFATLQPGEYIVMTHEWRGDTPLPFDGKSITTQYPPVFLGDAPALKSATPIPLHAGEVANVELHLHSATYYPVSIPVAGQPTGLNITIGSGFTSGYTLGYVARDHAVEGSLPSGSYDLHLISQAMPDGLASAELNIHVAGAPLRTAPVTLAPAGNLTVRVHLELTSTSTPEQVGLNLHLQPDEMSRVFVGNMQPGQSEFTINGVAPGRYAVLPSPTYGYVSRITSGGVDLLQGSLVVDNSGSPEPIDVTIRDDSATLSGKLQTGDATAQNRSFVLLIAEGNDRPVQTAFAFNSLVYSLNNIPPGTYRLFALSNAARELPYRDPQAMLPWLRQGKLITLAPGEKASADAPLITPPESATAPQSFGGFQ